METPPLHQVWGCEVASCIYSSCPLQFFFFFSCSLELHLCSNEEARGVCAMGWRHAAVILFFFEGDQVFNCGVLLYMWPFYFELLKCSSLCLFNGFFLVFRLWLCMGILFFFFHSVFHLLFVIHLPVLFLAPVSPSPGWRCTSELFLSWITHINCRGQTEWILRDNDWSDGSGCHQIVACLSLS